MKQHPKARAKALRTDGYASQLEADYAAVLELERRAGTIHAWMYQPLRLILADRCTYEPDFLVIHNSGELEFRETKGYFREDAKIKTKVAARTFPWFTFVVVQRKSKKAPWVIEEVTP